MRSCLDLRWGVQCRGKENKCFAKQKTLSHQTWISNWFYFPRLLTLFWVLEIWILEVLAHRTFVQAFLSLSVRRFLVGFGRAKLNLFYLGLIEFSDLNDLAHIVSHLPLTLFSHSSERILNKCNVTWNSHPWSWLGLPNALDILISHSGENACSFATKTHLKMPYLRQSFKRFVI